jgi:hypothetical protein
VARFCFWDDGCWFGLFKKCMCVCVGVCMCVYVFLCVYVCTYVFVCVYVCICALASVTFFEDDWCRIDFLNWFRSRRGDSPATPLCVCVCVCVCMCV